MCVIFALSHARSFFQWISLDEYLKTPSAIPSYAEVREKLCAVWFMKHISWRRFFFIKSRKICNTNFMCCVNAQNVNEKGLLKNESLFYLQNFSSLAARLPYVPAEKKLSSLLLLSFHLNKNVRKSAHGTTTGKDIFAYLRFCFWNWFVWSSSFMKKKNIKNRKSSIEWVHNWDKRKKLKRQNRTNGNHCYFVMRATKKNFRITACVVNWQKSLHHLSKTWERKKCLHIFLCLSFI